MQHYTSLVSNGDFWVWCALGLAIAEDRNAHACLFMEDAGQQPGTLVDQPAIEQYLNDKIVKIAEATYLCGQDQKTTYKEMYCGWKATYVPQLTVGCALTCAPYVTLPDLAFGNISPRTNILNMDTNTWLGMVGMPYVDEPAYGWTTVSGPAV